MDIAPLLEDPCLADQAFAWVNLALQRQGAAGETVAMLPPVAPGVFITSLNVCQDYSCNCGWNLTVNGRDDERHDRLLALVGMPESDDRGAFKLLAHRENGKLWSMTLAGTDDMGLDAAIALLL